MPRARLPQLHSITDGSFEPIRKNPILLGDDDVLDVHQKVIKIGGVNTPLSLSNNEVLISSDLMVNGENVILNKRELTLQDSANNQKIELNNEGFSVEIGDDSSSFTIDESGQTAINTTDADGSDGHITLSADGTVFLDSTTAGGVGLFNFCTGKSYLANMASLQVGDNGATTISTSDSDGTIGHLTLQPDGDLILDPASNKTIINATDALYFDGGTHTNISESSDDTLSFVVGGTNLVDMVEAATNAVNINNSELTIDSTKKLYLDGHIIGNTYITEASADSVRLVVGGDILLQLTESGDDGNNVSFRDASAGFTRLEATFSATGIIGSGGTDDTDIDFRFSNKYRLEMTGDITTINLIFPESSGNFLLVCTTNGDHDVSNWKVFESDESAATTTDVLWAGGSIPAFTNNGVDIVSFYWDANEQQAYGVASLAFATP